MKNIGLDPKKQAWKEVPMKKIPHDLAESLKYFSEGQEDEELLGTGWLEHRDCRWALSKN